MKLDEFKLIEKVLGNAADMLQEDIVETCDTSIKVPNWEKEAEIEDWNNRFNHVLSELLALKEEMIFTFKIEDEKDTQS